MFSTIHLSHPAVPGSYDGGKSMEFLRLMIEFEVEFAEREGRDPYGDLLKKSAPFLFLPGFSFCSSCCRFSFPVLSLSCVCFAAVSLKL